MDQSDFDWSDTDKMLEKASIAFLNGLRKNPEIRYSIKSLLKSFTLDKTYYIIQLLS
jgi:hypothetical protein